MPHRFAVWSGSMCTARRLAPSSYTSACTAMVERHAVISASTSSMIAMSSNLSLLVQPSRCLKLHTVAQSKQDASMVSGRAAFGDS
ncbi:hypothetical protein DUNSADRAFT_3366 [Dunaliella salina]|uniref:Secreted protein n=1 Tax=Dunaliella salina TaxID=3046 RepID=A0ABQ7GU26_DUNSA|nr:hypothetical protein DUNSADRAFT_3366 [Dunaliella salina]|eukprot:KAF5838116.1 hypothetical protein DUNSADRAFT_3366 [Dunaliella salina]